MKTPSSQEDQRTEEELPAMFNRVLGRPRIEPEEPAVALLLQRLLHLLFRTQKIVAQQRKKAHRNQPRGDQRHRHHDRQAVKKLARASRHQQERQIGHDVGDRGIHDRRRQLRRAQPRGNDVWVSLGQRPLDRITGNHRIIHQQPESNDQRRDRYLLNIDPEQVQGPERHRQRDRDGDGHQHGGAPLPEAEPGNQHHQRDRLVQRIHEQAEILFYLQRLVRSAGDDQIVRQILLHRRQLGVDATAERVDLLPVLHLHRNRDCAAASPVAVLVRPGQVIQILRRALVSARNIDQVAQVNRALRGGRRGADDHVADLLRIR